LSFSVIARRCAEPTLAPSRGILPAEYLLVTFAVIPALGAQQAICPARVSPPASSVPPPAAGPPGPPHRCDSGAVISARWEITRRFPVPPHAPCAAPVTPRITVDCYSPPAGSFDPRSCRPRTT
jgi:hypothetical protein